MDFTTKVLQQLKSEKDAIDETIAALELLSRRQAKAEAAMSAKADFSSGANLKSASNSKSRRK